MAKAKLTARGAETRKAGKHADGGGLYLIVEKSGARAWWFIFTFQGRRPEMKLGDADIMSLAEAREAALDARKKVAAGINPIDARKAAKSADAKPTFGEVADKLIELKESEWRNAIHAKQWRSSLLNDAAKIRPLPVDQVDTDAVLSVLTPIWQTKPEAAMRLRQRIEAVLNAAKVHGHRTGENPAAWRGHLALTLPKRSKVSRGHYAAMPYDRVAEFMTRLRAVDTVAARGLEFAILTAARSGEVYGARWSEFDAEGKLWTIPKERMKAGEAHRVPLCKRAAAILAVRRKVKQNDFVFPGIKPDKGLSHVMFAKTLSRLGENDVTPHGFRSAFRDWAGNETPFPREVAEQALAHTIGDKAERAYRRGDALEKRRALMEAWANFCEPTTAANIFPLKTAGSAA